MASDPLRWSSADDAVGRRPARAAGAGLLLVAVTMAIALATPAPGTGRVATAGGATPAPTVAARATTTTTTTDPVAAADEVPLAPDTAAPEPPPVAPLPDTAPTAATTAPVVPVVDPADPAVVAREIPAETLPPFTFTSPWASVSRTVPGGYTSVQVGCADGTDAGSLDRFLAERIGPVLGLDYQHVYPLGGQRYLWLFQDTFVDHSGLATRLDQAVFVHNSALVQDGACFQLLHRGTPAQPASFEGGLGEQRLTRWFWPMGGELTPAGLQVFWVEMVKDAYEPGPGDGLGWHPQTTYLATYDPGTLARTSFQPAADPGVAPIYGYAVSSDDTHTYLFGNTFEQNLVREGGFENGPHSATEMRLARVPRGDLMAPPEYRTADGWSSDAAQAVAISQRYWVENPMQPRWFDGVWTSVTKLDGYWGDHLVVDVANDPWGPWTTVAREWLSPRGGDALMNTYHAHLMPWRDAAGNLVAVISQNARAMTRDAFPSPARYRPQARTIGWTVPPPRPPETTVPETTVPDTTVPDTTIVSDTTVPDTITLDTTTLPAPPTEAPTTLPPTTSATASTSSTAAPGAAVVSTTAPTPPAAPASDPP